MTYSKRCSLGTGCVSPQRVMLTPEISTLHACKCPSAAHSPISCSQLSSMGEAEDSAPASPHLSLPISARWKEGSGTYHQLWKETSLPLHADFRSHHYSNRKTWIQSTLSWIAVTEVRVLKKNKHSLNLQQPSPNKGGAPLFAGESTFRAPSSN